MKEKTNPSDFFTLSPEETLDQLATHIDGITTQEALIRQKKYGLNMLSKKRFNAAVILIRQITSNALLIILIAATIVSYLVGERISSYYIFGIIFVSIFLGFWNEYSAEKTVETLLKKISATALIVRNGERMEIPVSHITIGDIVLISQGSIIPADLRIITIDSLEINESTLTGESKSVYKTVDLTRKINSDTDISNCAFMGTSVVSGNATGVVVRIGQATEFGKIAKISSFALPTTDFERGLNDFGRLIVKTILILVITICVVNIFLGHNFLVSILFSLAIAVGMTPELLPVLVTVSLSHGAGRLAHKKVISKRLISIENLGNMDILCTDKTGTLTEGNIHVIHAVDAYGSESGEVINLATICNSAIIHHKAIGNPIDVAIWNHALYHKIVHEKSRKKLFDAPFNFDHKAMFSVIDNGEKALLVVKGSPDMLLPKVDKVPHKQKLLDTIQSLNNDGIRLIVVAQKEIAKKETYSWKDVSNLEYTGYISFEDIPKKSSREAIQKFEALNVGIKVITGDNEIVTRKICEELGMTTDKILLGTEIAEMTEDKLVSVVNDIHIFARVTPIQKLAIIAALKKNGHTVGYMGDGINDVPSLRAADVGISVNTAVDVARDAASIVLLRKSLEVIVDGIIEGRRTFSNTIKYILMSTSSNFGNMFSAAGASFFLPFLPMLPVQLLLTNGLYDLSQLSIPTDNVDAESLVKPRHWDISFIKNYMLFFGPLSSLYDFVTFGIMIFVLHAGPKLFQTGWFIESLATEILVVFAIRTSRTPFFLSRPSMWLVGTCGMIVLGGLALPFSPLAHSLGFVIPPPQYFIILILLVTTYITLVEFSKMFFLRKFKI